MDRLLTAMLRVGPASTHRRQLLVVARDGSWFQWDDAPVVDLSSRAGARVVLRELVDRHAHGAAAPASLGELAAKLQHGEEPITLATRAWAHEAVSMLLDLGLTTALEQTADGYRLAGTASIEELP